ncbi:MAG: NfeD family protein [Methanomicrobiales archaeon]
MLGIQGWIIIAAVAYIGEMLTTGFFLLWFGVGATVAAILAYFGFSPNTQMISFILVSLVLLGISRPLANRISKDTGKKATSDRLIGMKGIVIEEIHPETGGIVKINGDTWRAISNHKIEVNKVVIVERIDSVKLVVKEVEKVND